MSANQYVWIKFVVDITTFNAAQFQRSYLEKGNTRDTENIWEMGVPVRQVPHGKWVYLLEMRHMGNGCTI